MGPQTHDAGVLRTCCTCKSCVCNRCTRVGVCTHITYVHSLFLTKDSSSEESRRRIRAGKSVNTRPSSPVC